MWHRRLSARNRPSRQGYTLLEVMVVVAIIGVLASLATVALMYGAQKVRLSNATFEVASLLPAARSGANALGVPRYVAFWQDADEAGVVSFELPAAAMPDWATVDFKTLAGLGAQRVERVALGTSTSGTRYVPLAGAKLPAAGLPRPFRAVPVSAVDPAGVALERACSFCARSGARVYGVLRFDTRGLVDVVSAGAPAGGAVALGTDQGGGVHTKVLAISTPGGLARVF